MWVIVASCGWPQRSATGVGCSDVLGFASQLAEGLVAGDVVAIKDCPRFVSADRHRHSFTHASTNHVADSRPPQVVKHARRLHHDFFYSVNDLGDRIASFIELRLRQPSALHADAQARRGSRMGWSFR
jgi:hypothetical protein